MSQPPLTMINASSPSPCLSLFKNPKQMFPSSSLRITFFQFDEPFFKWLAPTRALYAILRDPVGKPFIFSLSPTHNGQSWIGLDNWMFIMKQFLPHIFGNTALVKVVLAQEQKVKYPASHLVSKRSGAQGKQREIKRWGAANTNVSFEEIQITGVGQIRSEQEISPCFLPRIRFILCSRAVQ